LASGVLLIFATGVLVELVGEVFLARAVANVVWSYAELSDQTAQWSHARRKMLAGAYIAFLGTLRAPFYFAFGLFGGSKWRMRIEEKLSEDAKNSYSKLPKSVRTSIERSLGNNAEFGRRALIDRLGTAAAQRWARRLMDRPKDVLALISAIVIALLLVVFTTRAIRINELDSVVKLEAARSTLSDLTSELTNKLRSIDPSEVPIRFDSLLTSNERWLRSFRQIQRSIHELELATRAPYVSVYKPGSPVPPLLKYGDSDDDSQHGVFSDGTLQLPETDSECAASQSYLSDQIRFEKPGQMPDKTKVDEASSLLAAFETYCPKISKVESTLPVLFKEAQDQIAYVGLVELWVRLGAAASTLFLYVAFFTTLTSATISVLEIFGLEQAKSSSADSVDSSGPKAVLGDG
jgi:hypothetical protein